MKGANCVKALKGLNALNALKGSKATETVAALLLYLLPRVFSTAESQEIGRGMCQVIIGKESFDEKRVFKMQLLELCSAYVHSKAHRLAAALA